VLSQSSHEGCDATGVEPSKASPDWSHIHKELRRPGVTAKLLWLQCRQQVNYANSYQKFCRSYRQWLSRLNSLMRCHHIAGEKMFAGYIDIKDSYVVDTSTGETLPTCLFLAVLGASGYCYAEPCMSKDIDSWISGHIHALRFFQGATKCLVPSLSESDCQLSRHVRYRELARRCYANIQGLTASKVLPFSGYHKKEFVFELTARSLAKVLCHQYFVGSTEINSAVQNLINQFNVRPFKKLPGSPMEWFETLERDCLIPLPSMEADQEFWLHQNVTGTHINIDQHYYSVPQSVIGQPVDVKVTGDFVEVFFQGQQITSHPRQNLPGRSSTKAEHQVGPQKSTRDWSADRVLRWAEKIGPATTYLTSTILAHANNSPAGVRSCLGLLTLETDYGRDRLESACRQAATRRSWTVTSIRSMLNRGFDQAFMQLTIPDFISPAKSAGRKKKQH